ncbi:MAG TPA: PAS domain S-box protein [Bacteroidota bacterium]|nr:PAS domain S-box protein [Bacteroidota bacterium]
MKKKQLIPDDTARLRTKAEEEYSRKRTSIPETISDAEAHRLLHELQVHQIELEMQNESMRQIMEKAEHAARQYADLYEEIYDYSPSGYFTLDRAGVIRKLNLSGATLLERERTNVVGVSFNLFIEEEDEEAFKRFLERVFAEQRKISTEVHLRVQSRETMLVHIEARIAEDDNSYLLTAIDITEHVMIEDELRSLNAQIRKDAFIKNELLNEVNHRVKNNLMTIIGLVLAEKRHALDDRNEGTRLVCEKIESRIRGLLKVHQMLSDHHWDPIALSELAFQICSLVIDNSPTPEKVSLEIAESNIEVLPREANNLALILNELTVNSSKYAFQQSVKPVVSIVILQENDLVMLEYRDNGPGYPPEVIQDGSHRVGLQLIRQLVEGLPDGDISFRNDGGAVVTMRFHVAEGADA